MIKYFRFFVCVLVFFMLIITCAYSIENKKTITPNVFSNINIPDGEFLRYGNYINGRKYADYYFVTKKVDNGKGGFYYRTYINVILDSNGKKPTENYTTWPSYCLIDPNNGTLIESEANLNPLDLKNWAGLEGAVYWHNQMNYEKKRVDTVVRFVKNNITNEKKLAVKLNPDLRTSEFWMYLVLQPRFIDYQTEGLMNFVNPLYFTAPIRYWYKVGARETTKTSAGEFHVIKYFVDIKLDFFVILDSIRLSFVGTDVASKINKPFDILVEDTDRRLLIKMENTMAGGGDYILEEITNVK